MILYRHVGTYLFAVFLAILVALVPCAAQAEGQETVGILTASQGKVSIARHASPPEGFVPVRAGVREQVFMGDVLKTGPGAKAKVLLRDDSLITLSEDSELEITSALFEPEAGRRSTTVKLMHGLARAVIRPINSPPSDSRFNIVTPTAVMGVRGSEGIVQVTKAGASYKVTFWSLKSTWDISSTDPNVPGVVQVSPGHFTEVLKGRLPEAPRPIPPSAIPRLQRATTLVEVAFKRPTPSNDKGPPINNLPNIVQKARVKQNAKVKSAKANGKKKQRSLLARVFGEQNPAENNDHKAPGNNGLHLGKALGRSTTNNAGGPPASAAGGKTQTGLGNGPPAGVGNGPPAAAGNSPPAAAGNGPPAGVGNGPPAAAGNGPPAGVGNGPPAAAGNGPPAGVPAGPSAGASAGPPAGVPAGPPASASAGPPAGVPAGPPAGASAGPPAGVPAGPPAGVSAGPPTSVPAGPPAGVSAGPPTSVPAGPPAGVSAGPPASVSSAPPIGTGGGPPIVVGGGPPSGAGGSSTPIVLGNGPPVGASSGPPPGVGGGPPANAAGSPPANTGGGAPASAGGGPPANKGGKKNS